MLVEARVLRGNHSVLKIGRNLFQRNEFVVFVIRSAVNPCLQVALDVYGGGGRVNPAGGEKDQRGNRPKEREADDDPFENGSKRALATRG